MSTVLVVVLAASPAIAAPRGRTARRQFDRGVAAYTRGDYGAAAAALRASADLEADPETLYALAQAERKLDHCDRAIRLFQQLLGMHLPAANRRAIAKQLEECREIVKRAAPAPVPPAPPETPPAASEPEPPDASPPPPVDASPPPVEHPAIAVTSDGVPVRATPRSGGSPWWRDPIGDTLLGSGLVGIGVGVVFLAEAYSADQQKSLARSYPDYLHYSDEATTDGQIGLTGLAAGGVLATLAAIWYATHHGEPRQAPVTGWLVPGGGGLGVSGSF